MVCSTDYLCCGVYGCEEGDGPWTGCGHVVRAGGGRAYWDGGLDWLEHGDGLTWVRLASECGIEGASNGGG